jgi:hypothetical protein
MNPFLSKGKKMKNYKLLAWLVLFSGTLVFAAQEDAARDVYDKLPVKEVTVFKDGHAYVLHEGPMKTDDKGNVLLDSLPNPVMGTFWAYSTQPGVKLTSVISSRDKLDVEEASVGIEDLIKGNLGKEVIIKESVGNDTYQATLLRILEEKSQTPATDTDNRGNAYNPPPQPQNKLVLLKVAEGFKAVPISQIQSVTFLNDPSDKVTRKQQKETMTLQLDWNGKKHEPQAVVGMAYLQRGIRWIPSYRVEIDGKGKAVLKLQAAIINELADLNDVKTHLVIGVPTFAFKDVVDPVSFQETVARLSSHFRTDSSTAYAFSNAIMSQQVRAMPFQSEPSQPGLNLGPELEGSAKAEDLFVFTLDHITLKKGQRMVLPIAEFTLSYEDVYIADISFRPPLEVQRNFNSDQQIQLARLFSTPKAIHKIRLNNTSEYPLTTAPATILKDGQILAQGMMTYTAIGNKGDLELTTAINIGIKNSDEQTGATPNALNWNGSNWSKIDMQGTVELTNFSDKPVSLQVCRSVLGTVDKADHDAKIKQLGNGGDGYVFENGLPSWWSWCNWPWWWYRFNSVGQASWTIELKPNETVTLAYNWHYFWQ